MSNQMEMAAAAEFDQWATNGRAESMADGHRDATEQILDRWQLTAADRVLDVGCGNGWAVRWMLERGAGGGSGVDISPEMIARAQQLTAAGIPASFAVSPGERLPFKDQHFSAILSVESLYYYPAPAAALVEWARVSRPGGRLGIMVDLFAENPAGPVWKDALDVEVHLLSEADFKAMATAAGWKDVQTFRVIDRRPVKTEAEFTPSKWYPTYAIYVGYREAGSLGITARR
jgi:SAM-dependent methyltransferase